MSWERALEEHRAAVEVLVDTLGRVSDARWREPRAPGHWSSAQIAEHLLLSYEAALRELRGAGAMRLKLTSMRRLFLRWILLPHILFHRTFPIRAVSPREVLPSEKGADRDGVGDRLRELARDFEKAILLARKSGSGGLTHPYFGTIPPLRSVRFVTVHMEHHRRQIPEVPRTNS